MGVTLLLREVNWAHVVHNDTLVYHIMPRKKKKKIQINMNKNQLNVNDLMLSVTKPTERNHNI